MTDVLARLGPVKRSGSNWTAKCPAHDDTNPSLTVSVGAEGRVLLRCHRGCTYDEIVSALDLPRSALMGAAAASVNGNAHAQPKPADEHYDYTDAAGVPLFRVTRYYAKDADPAGTGGGWAKRFVQRHPDGQGGWAKGRGDAPLVPYRLPAVLASIAAGEPVYVVEGEKDVHTLAAWGIAATCNPGGAGKWLPVYAPHFAGADVVILPDNDEPGRKHAGEVAAALRGAAASVVVVDLPGLPERGDVTDWVRLGHDKAELAALVERVREAAPLADDVDLGPVRRPLVGLADVKPDAIRMLPAMLRELCGHYAAGTERTVALTSALAVLSGIMPRVRVAHGDKEYAPHLMFCLVARSGGGKAIMDQAATLAGKVDQTVRREAEYEREAWERERASVKRGQPFLGGPKPFRRSALIPADTSKSYILRAAAAGGETSLMVETEIDTLTNALGQEYGGFTDFVRKAFHHETYRGGRLGDGDGDLMVIEDPMLAMAISGTWDQFENLYRDSVDNGFFNRFCFVVANLPRVYRTQRPGPSTWERQAWYSRARADVLELWNTLRSRPTPLTVHIPDEGWDRIDAAYGPAYDRAAESPLADRALPFVQRSALMCARLTAVLTILRAWEHNVSLEASDGAHLTATGYDVALAVHIASVWYEHGAALLTQLTPEARPNPLVSLPDDARALVEALPDGPFRWADVVAAAESVGMTERKAKRTIQSVQSAGLILRSGHTYEKAPRIAEAVDFEVPQ